jgi:hypothetical protein
MSKNIKNSPKVLGLDVSTRTIGWALFDVQSQELLELMITGIVFLGGAVGGA